MTESCQFPIAFTPLIYGSIFVEQQMCSRFDEERITSRGDEVRELFSMPNLYLCDSTDNHNYIKILESDWSSAGLISAVIGQLHTSCACNWTVVRVMPE